MDASEVLLQELSDLDDLDFFEDDENDEFMDSLMVDNDDAEFEAEFEDNKDNDYDEAEDYREYNYGYEGEVF